MHTRPSLRTFALALSLATLSACASRPAQVCPQPVQLPADLAAPFPPPGYFQDKLEAILRQGATSAHNYGHLLEKETK